MGAYINVGNAGFQSSRNSEYVDKSGLIAVVNKTLYTKQRFSCVSRCRRHCHVSHGDRHLGMGACFVVAGL